MAGAQIMVAGSTAGMASYFIIAFLALVALCSAGVPVYGIFHISTCTY